MIELETDHTQSTECRTRRDEIEQQTELVGVELEDLGVAVPNWEIDEARKLYARLTECPPATCDDVDLCERVGGAERLVGGRDGAVGNLDQHSFIALVLDCA